MTMLNKTLNTEHYEFLTNFRNLQDLAMTNIFIDPIGDTFIIILRILLVVIAALGFSFYLWFLSISDEQSQNRILNILHGYLAVACLGLCPELIIVPYVNEQLYEFSIRIASFIIIAITLIFLLISVATILMHFRPGVYLELSWNHKIAAPTLLVFFIITEQLLNFSCPRDFAECEVSNVRRFLMIPKTVISFLCQLTVIVDVTLGWRNIYTKIFSVFRPNHVAPINNDMEMVEASTSAPQHPLYNPELLLDHHVVGLFIHLYYE